MQINLSFDLTETETAGAFAARDHSADPAQTVESYIIGVIRMAAQSWAVQWDADTVEGLKNRLAAEADAKARAVAELAQAREAVENLRAAVAESPADGEAIKS